MRFARGQHHWRVAGPRYFCEVDEAGNVPCHAQEAAVCLVQKVKEFYTGRLELGRLDELGTGLDIVVANALAESWGKVTPRLDLQQLRAIYDQAHGGPGERLNAVVRHVDKHEPNLVWWRRSYRNPISDPGGLKLGAHLMLVSTAYRLADSPEGANDRDEATVDLVLRLLSDALFAGSLAARHLESQYNYHRNQPPLLAAIYRDGPPRPAPESSWGMKCQVEHVERWVKYYNISRSL